MLLGLYLISKEKLKSSYSNNDDGDKESKEPGYDEDQDQLEEKYEEVTGEIRTTRNQVF
jgi:hypothetical protein